MGRQPRVLLDVDGVLADFLSHFLTAVHRVTGERQDKSKVTDYDICKSLGLDDRTSRMVYQEISDWRALARVLNVCHGAADGLRSLQSVADVWIVTSPWSSNPTWTHDREYWLKRHFGIPSSRVVHTSAKHLVRGDVLVDDRTETLHAWAAEHPGGLAVQWATSSNRQDGWEGAWTSDWSELVAMVRAHKEAMPVGDRFDLTSLEAE